MRALRRLFEGGRPRQVTGAMGLARRAANAVVLWLAVAGGLAMSGRRRPRRAAMRGLFGAALASAIAHGPVKLALRRRPPAARRLAGRLPGVPGPSTGPYPSGYAASGFGFAMGAAQEMPVVAAPLVSLAGLVAYSRVRNRLHEPWEAGVGAAIGLGAAVVTRRLWPVAPDEPARARTALTRSRVDPSPEGDGLAIVVNASAGSGDKAAEELRKELPRAEVIELEEGDDLQAALERAASSGRVMGVAGGDGSINTAADLAAARKMPLVVVPGGTLNHFAHALGVETVADAAAAVRDGRTAAVDRGVIDGHTFVNTASIGSYVDLVDAREKLENRIGKWPAVIVALWRVLRVAEPVDLELDGDRRRVWMIFIGNCRYDPPGFAPTWRERLDDRELDIRIIDAVRPWSRVQLLLAVLTGRLRSCGVYEQRYVSSMQVRSRVGPLRLGRDGETFDGSEEFAICKADEPLVVFVPEPSP